MVLTPGVRLVERPGVLHFFDGRRVVSVEGDDAARATVLDVLNSDDPADDVAPVRALLVRLGLVPATPPTEPGEPSVGALFAAAADPRTPADTAARRLGSARVHVWSDDDILLDTLADSGLRVRRLAGLESMAALDPARDVLVVTASDDQPARSLEPVNRACLDAGITWLPIGAFDGAVLRVGPLFVPGHTACAACLHRRLAANVAYADLYDCVADVTAAPTPAGLRRWAYGVAALLMLRWLATGEHALPGRLFSLDPADLTIRSAPVRRVPRCPVCRAPEHVPAAAPWGFARDH